jgi:hypothetical protein
LGLARSGLVVIASLSVALLSTVGCAVESTDDELSKYQDRKGAGASGADGESDEPGQTGSRSTNAPGASSGASGSTNDGTSPGNVGPRDFAQICVDEINRFRATKGLPALARWTEGESCADEQSAADGRTGRAHGAFGRCRESAQNECPGWNGSPETMIKGCLQMMWDEGPGGGHHDTMASRRYTMVACGQAPGRRGTWSVQNFK